MIMLSWLPLLTTVHFGADLVDFLVLRAIQRALLVFFLSKPTSPPARNKESETSVSMMKILTLESFT
jgi:hypothetical protein